MGNISVHGFYGMGNLGDEAILAALLKEMKRRGDHAVTVFSRDPAQVSRDHGVPAVDADQALARFKRSSVLKGSDVFLLGGGGLLKDYGEDSRSIKGWLRLLVQAQTLGVKTATYAIGVENVRFDESRKTVRKAMDGTDLIMVRDDESREELRSFGVGRAIMVVADPAVLLVPPEFAADNPESGGRPRIAFCLRHWFSTGNVIEDEEKNERLLDSLAAAADALVGELDARVEFIPMRAGGVDDDRKVAAQVAARMKKGAGVKQRDEVPSIDGFIATLRKCDMVVGMRLHSLILATAAGVPALGISYMAKVRRYMESAGLSKLCADPRKTGPDELRELALQIIKRRESLRKSMGVRMKELRRDAGKGFSAIAKLAAGKGRRA